LTAAKSEIADLGAEHQREMESLLENVRQLSRELQLQMLIIDSFIPQHYQELIEQNATFIEEYGDWQLKCIAYTGNNMRKRESRDLGNASTSAGIPDFSDVYLTYAVDAGVRLKPEGSTSTAKAVKRTTKKERRKAQLNALLR